MLESNYLTILLKPYFEKPVDTAEDIIDRDLDIIYYPGSEAIVEQLKNSPLEVNRALAERRIVPKVIFLKELLK